MTVNNLTTFINSYDNLVIEMRYLSGFNNVWMHLIHVSITSTKINFVHGVNSLLHKNNNSIFDCSKYFASLMGKIIPIDNNVYKTGYLIISHLILDKLFWNILDNHDLSLAMNSINIDNMHINLKFTFYCIHEKNTFKRSITCTLKKKLNSQADKIYLLNSNSI